MKMRTVSYALAALAIALPGCMLPLGCISIKNHVHLGPASEGGDAEATMGYTAPTNDVSATVRGSVAINSAIYSHKVISPDTTATLAK